MAKSRGSLKKGAKKAGKTGLSLFGGKKASAAPKRRRSSRRGRSRGVSRAKAEQMVRDAEQRVLLLSMVSRR